MHMPYLYRTKMVLYEAALCSKSANNFARLEFTFFTVFLFFLFFIIILVLLSAKKIMYFKLKEVIARNSKRMQSTTNGWNQTNVIVKKNDLKEHKFIWKYCWKKQTKAKQRQQQQQQTQQQQEQQQRQR